MQSLRVPQLAQSSAYIIQAIVEVLGVALHAPGHEIDLPESRQSVQARKGIFGAAPDFSDRPIDHHGYLP
jgi:hypothetical protein